MIEIRLKNCCKNCYHSSLAVEDNIVSDFSEPRKFDSVVYCRHEDVCIHYLHDEAIDEIEWRK